MVERGSRHQAENSCHSSSLSQPPPTRHEPHADIIPVFSHFVVELCGLTGRFRAAPAPRRPTTGHAPARAPVGVARRAKRARTARRGRAGCSRRARRPPRRGRRWGRKRRPGAPAGRRRAKYEGRVRSPRRRVRGRRTCPGASSARPCARRPGPGRGARRAAAPPWPSWAPTGASRSRQKPPARFVGISVNFGRFRSFFLLGVGIPVVLGDGMRAREIVGTRAPPQLLPSRPGRASAAVRDPQKSNQHPRLVVVDLAPILRRSVGAVMSMDRPPRRSTRGKAAGPAWHPCRARRRRRSAPRGGAAPTIRARVSPERLPPAARLLRHI